MAMWEGGERMGVVTCKGEGEEGGGEDLPTHRVTEVFSKREVGEKGGEGGDPLVEVVPKEEVEERGRKGFELLVEIVA